jgi:hypothetical protein
MSFPDLFKIRCDEDQNPIPIVLLMVLLFVFFIFKMFDG